MIEVNVKLFAVVRDLVGTNEKILELPRQSRAGAVIDRLISEYPDLLQWKDHLRVAVNREYVSIEHELNDHDEVAIIPPVSGG